MKGEGRRRLVAALLAISFLAFGNPVAGRQPAGIPEIAAADLPHEARETLKLIRQGGPFPYERDGVVFGNFEKRLPIKERGYYREYTVKTPGVKHRGARRIVAGRCAPDSDSRSVERAGAQATDNLQPTPRDKAVRSRAPDSDSRSVERAGAQATDILQPTPRDKAVRSRAPDSDSRSVERAGAQGAARNARDTKPKGSKSGQYFTAPCSAGELYYTDDHYQSFKRIRE